MLLRDSVRLVVAIRGLTAGELESFHSRKFFAEVIKVATDGIALIVNPDSLINLDMLQKLLTGRVKSRDELYPGSRLGDFRVVFDHPGSGGAGIWLILFAGGSNYPCRVLHWEVIRK